MAHFAELDENNIVVTVTVVDNNIETSNGKLGVNDMHVDGETWCKNFFNQPDTTFKQTSYNNNFRKQYAGKGYTYDDAKDKFICPQPHASWSLDGNDDWQAPIARPDNENGARMYLWDETLYQSDNSQGWVEVT